MDDQTWRVVLESGEVMEVLVWQGVTAGYYATHDGMEVRRALRGRTPRAAICTLAGHGSWPVREIVAPGEATAEERVQRAHRDGVLRGLTVAREHAVAVIDGGTGLPAIDWTDVVAATGDALARVA